MKKKEKICNGIYKGEFSIAYRYCFFFTLILHCGINRTTVEMDTAVQVVILSALLGIVAAHGCNTGQQPTRRYCFTKWFDRDNPSGYGDYELLTNLAKSQVCPRPVGIECQTVSGQPYNCTGRSTSYDSLS